MSCFRLGVGALSQTRFYNTVSALQPQSSNKSIVSNLMGRYLTKPNTFVHGGALGRTSRMDDEDTEEEQSEANTLQAPSDFQSPSVSNVHAGAAEGDRVAATDPTKTSTLRASNLQKMSNQADAASDGNNVATQLWVDNSGPWEEGSMRMQRRGSQESGFTEHVSVSRTVSHDMSGAYARFLQQRQMSMTRSDSISRSQVSFVFMHLARRFVRAAVFGILHVPTKGRRQACASDPSEDGASWTEYLINTNSLCVSTVSTDMHLACS